MLQDFLNVDVLYQVCVCIKVICADYAACNALDEFFIEAPDPAAVALVQRIPVGVLELCGIIFLIFQAALLAFKIIETDFNGFLRCIVLKVKFVWNTRLETRIRLQKLLHFLGVSCKDNHDFRTVVFHVLENRINGFLTKICT